ncbi:hypothetical protein L2E82_20640 [Cichorium intybus]|uniref:Uncharacterized protein n=1 Tax=Cichorium intybus TaxID=13427 RepID=A0ACB9DU88_CICIN|nr:hypothetical protein L2E82_20640 [Cichorium intybus]
MHNYQLLLQPQWQRQQAFEIQAVFVDDPLLACRSTGKRHRSRSRDRLSSFSRLRVSFLLVQKREKQSPHC